MLQRACQNRPGNAWDEVALDKVKVAGDVLVVDEMAGVAAPLTAVKLARAGARVRLLTKWPMIGMETAAEVYLHWILTYLCEADVEMIADHAVKNIDRSEVEIVNIYQPTRSRLITANTVGWRHRDVPSGRFTICCVDARSASRAIGCAVAPRTVYEATLDGHRAGRKLGAPPSSRAERARSSEPGRRYEGLDWAPVGNGARYPKCRVVLHLAS